MNGCIYQISVPFEIRANWPNDHIVFNSATYTDVNGDAVIVDTSLLPACHTDSCVVENMDLVFPHLDSTAWTSDIAWTGMIGGALIAEKAVKVTFSTSADPTQYDAMATPVSCYSWTTAGTGSVFLTEQEVIDISTVEVLAAFFIIGCAFVIGRIRNS